MDANMWVAIGTIGSMLIAFAALGVSLHTKWQNRKYKEPAFRIDPSPRDKNGNPRLKLTNAGATRASNVVLKLEVDPKGVFVGDTSWSVIDPGESVAITFTPHRGYLAANSDEWFIELFMTDPSRHDATVEYTPQAGRRVQTAIRIPNEPRIEISEAQSL